jgi:hypothetical protein
MKWIESTGGPLILIDETLRLLWGGVDSGHSHYMEACSINDYLGVVRVDSGEALILGEEPLTTTWISGSQLNGALCRVAYAETVSSAETLLRQIPDQLPSVCTVEVSIVSAQQAVFDAAVPGKRVTDGERLDIVLAPGRYRVETALFNPDERHSFVIHGVRQV